MASKGIIPIIVTVVVFIVVLLIAFFVLPNADYSVDYDSEKGDITIEFEDAKPISQWEARIHSVEHSSNGGEIRTLILKNAPVTQSSDGKTMKVSDPKLINLIDADFDIELDAEGQETIYCTFSFDGHAYSDGEMTWAIVAWVILGIFLVLAIIRRIVRGRW